MTGISAEIRTRDLELGFKRLIKKARDTAPLMRNIAGIMLDAAEHKFKIEGDPKWPDLKASTKRARKKKGKGHLGKILQDEGKLAASLSRRSTMDSAIVGSNMPYAATQHFGGTIHHPGGTPFITTDKGTVFMRKDGKYPRGVRFTKPHDITIPARPYLNLTAKDIEKIKKAAGPYLVKK